MSQFENYEEVCKVYDKNRRPIGISTIVKNITSAFNGNDFSKLRLLDAGCGTGNYSMELVKHGFKDVTLLDASPGMLSYATKKISAFNEGEGDNDSKVKMEAVVAKLPEIPFPENSFDVVICNFVIHHLEKNDRTFPKHRKLLQAFNRVLKPSGYMSLLFFSEQQFGSLWYEHVLGVEKHRQYLYDATVENSEIILIAEESGFKEIESVVPLTEILSPPEIYFDYHGIFRKEWRDGTSVWATVGEDATQEVIGKMRKIIDSGELDKQAKIWDAFRLNHGQCTILTGRK